MISELVLLVYIVGFAAFFINAGCYETDGHLLFGRALLWPLFAIKHFALAIFAGVDALIGRAQ